MRNQINDLKAKTRHANADLFTPTNLLSTGPQGPVEAIGGAENADTDDTREMVDQVLRWTKLEPRVRTLLGNDSIDQSMEGNEYAIPRAPSSTPSKINA